MTPKTRSVIVPSSDAVMSTATVAMVALSSRIQLRIWLEISLMEDCRFWMVVGSMPICVKKLPRSSLNSLAD